MTEKPRKQVSEAQPIVAGIGIGGCEGWSQSCYVRELNGRVVSAAADNHMVRFVSCFSHPEKAS